ncbi:MAG: UTP--glucose-1-phosphate uridylyltransferase [Solirubrobacteraceae bacterium]
MSGLDAGVEKLRADGAGDAAIASFRHYYGLLESGDEGMLAERDIEPVADVPSVDDLSEDAGPDVLDQAVVLKLNGGLGTSMGMTRAKSLLEVRDGQSFLDIIVRQVLELRERTGARLPLVLMNSFATREDSLAALAKHPEIAADVPADLLQNKLPKLTADGLEPVEWPAEPGLEWAPPGHGDLYTALVTSGMLGELLDHGYRYAFVSNSDNLGAVLEPRILAWVAREDIPFAMEVADRTAADRKGGHLAQRPDGGLVLREIAQTPDDDVEAFQDTSRHRFFNTNTLWVDLHALRGVIDARDGVLGLPMIVNRKTVDPSDKSSPAVVQLETAMGAAIDVFDGARALRVDRARFAPVKTTDDLLALRSDAYELTDDARVALVAGREDAPHVTLDPDYYKLLADFDARFPHGAPSLRECEALTVHGDVTFGHDVVVKGRVELEGPREVADGEVVS